jgi:hypothetical protein
LAAANTESISGKQQQQQQQPAAALSASAAFASAFCSTGAVEMQAAVQQQPDAQQDWQVFAAGPLVVEHSWGEPAERLQQQVAAAAAARLQCTASYTALRQQQQRQEDRQQQQEHLDEQRSLLEACCSWPFDYVVGADLLYDPAYHEALLSSLQQLCAPHTQVTRRCHQLRLSVAGRDCAQRAQCSQLEPLLEHSACFLQGCYD